MGASDMLYKPMAVRVMTSSGMPLICKWWAGHQEAWHRPMPAQPISIRMRRPKRSTVPMATQLTSQADRARDHDVEEDVVRP